MVWRLLNRISGDIGNSRKGNVAMRREEAIQLAKQLATQNKQLSVLYDRQLKDYIVSESDWYLSENEFYAEPVYELIATFTNDPEGFPKKMVRG